MAVTMRDSTAHFAAYFAGPSKTLRHTHPVNRTVSATNFGLSRPIPYPTMAMMQAPGAATLAPQGIGRPAPDLSDFPTSAHIHQETTPQAAVSQEAFLLEDLFPNQNEQNINGADAVAQWRGARLQPDYHMSFRPTDTTTGSFGSDTTGTGSFSSDTTGSFSGSSSFGPSDIFADINFPSKVDDSPMLPTPAFLPHEVDTSKYENVTDEAWPMSSLDYEALSPSSVDANSNGPLTPSSTDGSDLFARSLSVDGFHGMAEGLAGVDAKVSDINRPAFTRPDINTFRPFLSSGCQCPTCQGAFGQHTTLAQIFHAAQFQVAPINTQTYQPQNFNIIQHTADPYVGGARHVGTLAPATASQLPTNAQEINRMLVADRSAMDTTPEVSDGSDDDGSSDGDGSDSDGDVNDQAVAEAARRRARDRYLLEMRERGFSYKEIKRRGGFNEAESTLRGRVRVLTKDKSQRVRKPEWTANDIRLLNQAVDRHSAADPFGDLSVRDSHGRIPWKKISVWMESKGSSYTFAAATCAKMWRQMN